MLYITTKNEFGKFTGTWHVGARCLAVDVHTVVEVQADGDELALIVAMSDGTLPRAAAKRVVSYYGDHAKFIVGNFLR
jgi:hypothetical protein